MCTNQYNFVLIKNFNYFEYTIIAKKSFVGYTDHTWKIFIAIIKKVIIMRSLTGGILEVGRPFFKEKN